MRSPMLNASALLLLSSAAAQNTETPCQKCCAPGGDCSKAFKGTAGKCCGVVEGQAFCCPGVTFRGPNSGDAKCYNCGSTYRCFTGLSSGNVCGNGGGSNRNAWTRHYPRHREQTDPNSTLTMLLIGVVVIASVLYCARSQPAHDYAMGPKPSVAYGQPVGHPACGPPAGYGYGGGGYGYGGGYSGGSVAASAAAGFVGGMVVNDMLHHSGGDHYHHGGGDYGGGYGGGGGDFGGGDFGGGDSGFAADS